MTKNIRLRVKILKTEIDYAFKNLFRVVRAQLQFMRFDGEMSEPVTRINFERGQSVGVLLYDPEKDEVVLVRQFRYPVYASLDLEMDAGRAWLLEIVAGVREGSLKPEEVANKELLEEAGYKVRGKLQQIATIYPSPGGTSEKVIIYLGQVNSKQPDAKGGGVTQEHEDIQVVILPFQEAMQMLDTGEITDAKTVVALQYLALKKVRENALK